MRGVLGLVLVGAVAAAEPAPGYDVRIPDRLELAAGTPGSLGIAIAVDRGLTISRDAALIIDLSADAGVTIKKRRLGRGDAVDPEAESPRFAIPVRADGSAPNLSMTVRVRFWLCTTRACRPVDVQRKLAIAMVTGSGGSGGSGS
jgi:hypothetical protein